MEKRLPPSLQVYVTGKMEISADIFIHGKWHIAYLPLTRIDGSRAKDTL
jgi:hypothetical protein